jgi:hypothetical protein
MEQDACSPATGLNGDVQGRSPNHVLVRHEVADLTAVRPMTDTAPCSARGFLPQRAPLATAGCEACGTMEPQGAVSLGRESFSRHGDCQQQGAREPGTVVWSTQVKCRKGPDVSKPLLLPDLVTGAALRYLRVNGYQRPPHESLVIRPG